MTDSQQPRPASRTRDDFSARTKSDLALRASYVCSLCKRSTVGPSDEGTSAVTMTGVAAHICAAAPGSGARRYDATMTPEQRSHIDNGIWLCASCGTLIDRDEVRYPVRELHRIKREHESSRRLGDPATGDEGDIIAVGPDIVALGRIIRVGPDCMRVRLTHFVNGSGRDLWSLSRDFGRWPAERRYVLFNELGYGALLAGPPVIETVDSAFEVQFRLQDQAPRQDATAPIATMCRETGGLVRGMDAYIQIYTGILSMARGTWFADLASGSDLSDLYWRYHGSLWFARLAMMEMVRLASIPRLARGQGNASTPFIVVNQVNRVEVPTFDLDGQMLSINVEFDMEGMGRWSSALSIYILTPEQLGEGRATASLHSDRIRSIEAENRRHFDCLL